MYTYLQDRMASFPDALAQRSAGSDGLEDFLGAHGHVDAAEEELESLGASALDKGCESLQLKFRVLLQLVADEVGHSGDVVAEAAAHVDLDRVALAHDVGARQRVSAMRIRVDLRRRHRPQRRRPKREHHRQGDQQRRHSHRRRRREDESVERRRRRTTTA